MNTKLYWHWTTNPQKIRMALQEWKIPHELIPINLGKGDNKSSTYRAIHPKGSVPTLIFRRQTYWESNAALLALAQAYPEMLPPIGTTQHAEALNLLFMEACTFQQWAGVHFMQEKIYPLMGKPTNTEALLEAHQRLHSSYEVLNSKLAQNDFLLGKFSIIDCAYAPWLPYLNLAEYSNLERWLRTLRTLDSWKACGFRD